MDDVNVRYVYPKVLRWEDLEATSNLPFPITLSGNPENSSGFMLVFNDRKDYDRFAGDGLEPLMVQAQQKE